MPIDELIYGSTSATLNLWLMAEISRRQPNSALDLMAHLEADPGNDTSCTMQAESYPCHF